MGNSESSSQDAAPGIDDFDGIETLGYRVLGVQPNSPASASGLVSFFDFLIGANGEMLLGSGEDLQEGEEYNDIDFPALLETFKGKTLQLLVWNIKCQQQRLVDIVPSDDWEGAGLLGVTIRLDNYAGAEDRLIRILSVEVNSPAAIAGLVSSQDYLLGTTTHSFDSTKVLAVVLELNVDKVVELYVYNTNSDKVRVVALMPTWSWGGNGLLGAEVGTGYLHRLPGSCRGTLGGSVERRVRWIGGSKTGPMSPSQLQQAATLELEPQLEMEPNHEDDEDESMHTVSQQDDISSVDTTIQPTTIAAEPEQPMAVPAVTIAPPESQRDATVIATPDGPTINVFDPTATKPPITPARTPSAFQQSPTVSGTPVPAPYPLTTSAARGGMFPSDAAAQPMTVTTFFPAAKPPPEGKPVSAKDLFSGPPPVAIIPTKTSLTIAGSIGRSSSGGSVGSVGNVGSSDHRLNQFRKMATPDNNGIKTVPAESSPPFSTPHPPDAGRPAYNNTGEGNTPVPPVASGVTYGTGINDILPPPPKMSGTQRN
jgi:GRASP55/65 PDZ-like domain